MNRSLKLGRQLLSEGLDFPSQAQFQEIIELASSSSPVDRMYSHLQIDKARLARVETVTSRRMTEQYEEMMKELRRELTVLRGQVLGSNPTITQMVTFTQSAEVLSIIEQRVKELEPSLAGIITEGIQDAGIRGAESFLKDIEIMARMHDIKPEFLERVRLLTTPNLAAAEITIPLAVGDTRRITPLLINRIAERLREGAIRGESFRTIINSLAEIKDLTKTRAELIARWSMVKGYNEERLARFKQVRLPRVSKMWLSNLDNRVCPHCLALHGTITTLDSEFDGNRTFAGKPMGVYLGLDTPPRHPRCRCSHVLWREEWRDRSTVTPEKLFASAQDHARTIDKELQKHGHKEQYVNVDKIPPPQPIYKAKV